MNRGGIRVRAGTAGGRPVRAAADRRQNADGMEVRVFRDNLIFSHYTIGLVPD